MKYVISEHAIDRYLERVAPPGTTRKQAHARLLAGLRTGKMLKEKSGSGHPQMLISTPEEAVLVLKRTRAPIKGEAPTGDWLIATVYAAASFDDPSPVGDPWD